MHRTTIPVYEILARIEAWVQQPELRFMEVLSRTVSLLQTECPHYHWVGVYLLEGDALELGAYVGKPTEHTRIPLGVGVCGTAVTTGANQRIGDVTQLTNYLACSLETRSEIVVLIRSAADPARILGQIDIDSDELNAFDEADEQFLEQVARLLAPRLDERQKENSPSLN
jgi:GAF domain-containing protein